MKKVVFVLCLGWLLVVGCENVDDDYPFQPNCDEINGLQVESDGHFNNHKSLVPDDYTGIIKTCYNGKVILKSNIKDGKLNGESIFWNREIDSDEWVLTDTLRTIKRNYKNGKLEGARKTWYGPMRPVASYQLIEEVEYVDDLPIKRKGWFYNGAKKYDISLERHKDDSKNMLKIVGKCWDIHGNKIDCNEYYDESENCVVENE